MAELDKRSITLQSSNLETSDLQAAGESMCDLMKVKSSASLCSSGSCSRRLRGDKHVLDDLGSSRVSLASEGVSCEKCLICDHLHLKQRELRRNHRILLQKLQAHRRLSHSVFATGLDGSASEKLDICMNKSSSSSRATSLVRSSDGHGESGEWLVPWGSTVRDSIHPPKPRVRRLIGEEAKLIGAKIDSSNLKFVLGLNCDCDTQECKDSGKTSCLGHMCYTELHNNVITRGCDPTPLACENRKPMGIGHWPSLFCCDDKNFCNKYVVPQGAVQGTDAPLTTDEQVKPHQLTDSNCSNSESQLRRPGSRVVNPIYIAVPVAGVCVLLALVIFAMYLLRRKTEYHQENFHHFQQDPTLPPKQNIVPHHCQCTCKKHVIVTPCSKGNRCTDSERSSSGSETKLFLQS